MPLICHFFLKFACINRSRSIMVRKRRLLKRSLKSSRHIENSSFEIVLTIFSSAIDSSHQRRRVNGWTGECAFLKTCKNKAFIQKIKHTFYSISILVCEFPHKLKSPKTFIALHQCNLICQCLG